MPPAEQEIKVTPHDKKVANWNLIVAHAKEIFPVVLANALPGIKADLEKNPPQSDEDARAAKVKAFDRVAHNAFLLAQSFVNVRKRERGRYLAD